MGYWRDGVLEIEVLLGLIVSPIPQNSIVVNSQLSPRPLNSRLVLNNLGRNSSECKPKDVRIQPVGEEFGFRIGEFRDFGGHRA